MVGCVQVIVQPEPPPDSLSHMELTEMHPNQNEVSDVTDVTRFHSHFAPSASVCS